MKKFIQVFMLIVASSVMLTGCSQQVEVQLAPTVKVHFSDDRSKTIQITANDPAYQALAQWLKEHQSGWYPTSGQYPGGVYLVSGEQGIQVTQQRVVIYATKNKKPTATFVQEINRQDLLIVKNIAQQQAENR